MEPTLQHPVQSATTALKAGGLIIIPTETVYGLAADAANCTAIEHLYTLKNRAADQPFSLLISDLNMAERYGVFDTRARTLAKHFWPGAMTLIVQAKKDAPLCPAVLAKGTSIGLRVPAHEQTRSLIAHFGGALAAPSANISGAAAPLTTHDIAAQILDETALCLDGGPCTSGTASTLVDMTGDDIQILRKGDLSLDMIMKALTSA